MIIKITEDILSRSQMPFATFIANRIAFHKRANMKHDHQVSRFALRAGTGSAPRHVIRRLRADLPRIRPFP